jgi:predicted transcriptional regulator
MTTVGEERKEKVIETKGESAIRRSASGLLHLALCSDLRRGLLLSLNEGGRSLSSLREDLLVSSTTAIHALRMLEKAHITDQDDERNYVLSNIGKIMSQKLIDLDKTMHTLAKFEAFWLEHDISGIPDSLLKEIGCLHDTVLLTSEATDIYNVYETFTELIKTTREIRGISTIFHTELTPLFTDIVGHERTVELIVTRDVLNKILATADKERFKESLEGDLKLYVAKHDPKVAFTAGDYFISLGLFRLDGTYDYFHDLIGYSNEALRWGRALFNYHVHLSERFTL